jgi:hypothetical protein
MCRCVPVSTALKFPSNQYFQLGNKNPGGDRERSNVSEEIRNELNELKIKNAFAGDTDGIASLLDDLPEAPAATDLRRSLIDEAEHAVPPETLFREQDGHARP